MLDFPPDYRLHDRLPPYSPLDHFVEFLYRYHHLKIRGQGNTHYKLTDLGNPVYYKFLNTDTLEFFEKVLLLHIDNAITIKLRLPKKSEGGVRDGFAELLKPYNERIGFFKYELDVYEIYHNFDEIKKKLHERDTLFIDLLIHGYAFTMLFFKSVGEEKGTNFSGTPEESRIIERIGNMINHNPDSQEEITLHYKIEDYLSKYYLDYPIIYNLAENGFLEVRDVVFQNTEIDFILHRFNNFPMSIEKKDDSGLLFDEDSGKVFFNGELLVQLKLGKNDYKFFHALYLSLGKSVSYDDIKNHINKGRVSSTNEQYCHKIKSKLPESIKNLIKSTGEGYMLDTEAKKRDFAIILGALSERHFRQKS